MYRCDQAVRTNAAEISAGGSQNGIFAAQNALFLKPGVQEAQSHGEAPETCAVNFPLETGK